METETLVLLEMIQPHRRAATALPGRRGAAPREEGARLRVAPAPGEHAAERAASVKAAVHAFAEAEHSAHAAEHKHMAHAAGAMAKLDAHVAGAEHKLKALLAASRERRAEAATREAALADAVHTMLTKFEERRLRRESDTPRLVRALTSLTEQARAIKHASDAKEAEVLDKVGALSRGIEKIKAIAKTTATMQQDIQTVRAREGDAPGCL